MKIGVLFSGGKDSTYAVHYYTLQGWDISCLVTLVSMNIDSYMFHTPNISLAAMQAKALGIPIIERKTKGEKETELSDLRAALVDARKKYAIEGVAVGALFSDYQHERVNRLCEELGLRCFAPLWHKDQMRIIEEVVDADFEVVLQHVAADGLDASMLNKRMDADMLSKLKRLAQKNSMNVAGEGGEYETFVLDGPIFRKRLVLDKTEIVKDGVCASLRIHKAHLEEK